MKTAEFLKHEMSRRQFLGSSARNAAGVAAGMVALGTAAVAKAGPGERVALGVIGVRQQGKTLATGLAALPDADVTAVCDVDENLLPAAVRAVEEVQGFRPRRETDFRRLLDDPSLDAVVIATPDHWHALMAIRACQAGKDVYVETPVSHTLREGEAMRAAARAHGRIVQTGLPQRSGAHFRSAVELVQSGRLGPVRLARAWTVHKRRSIGRKSDGPTPEGVDYDRWLGPAAQRPFNPNRFHFNWQWFWEYGSGALGHWGVPMLDIARWGLGVDLPTRIVSTGGHYHFHDDQQTPDTQFVTYTFPAASALSPPTDNERFSLSPPLDKGGPGGGTSASQISEAQPTPPNPPLSRGGTGQEGRGTGEEDKTILWEHRLWQTHGIEGRSTAVAFYGELGTLVVDRGGWKVYDSREALSSDTSDLMTPHYRSFLDALRDRRPPTADLETGLVSSALCHLGNLAYRLGRELRYDPTAGDFGSDRDANQMLAGEHRAPWELPAIV